MPDDLGEAAPPVELLIPVPAADDGQAEWRIAASVYLPASRAHFGIGLRPPDHALRARVKAAVPSRVMPPLAWTRSSPVSILAWNSAASRGPSEST